MLRSRPVRWPIVLVVATVAAMPLRVAASPGDAPWDGAVFAGPTSPHGTNVSANPAAMLLAPPALHYFLGGAAVLEQLGIDRRVVDAGGTFSDGPEASGTTFGAGGHFGLALVSSRNMFSLMVALPPPDETIADRDALRYHTLSNRHRSLEGTFAGGRRVTSDIWFGFAATYSLNDRVLRFARDTAMEAGSDPTRGVSSDCGGTPCGLENPLATEVWSIDLDRDSPNPLTWTFSNLRLTVGMMFTLPGNTLLGVTYQRPWNLGRVDEHGTVRVVSAPRDGGTTRTGEATVYTRNPEVIRMGTRSRVRPRIDLVGEVRWRRLGRIGVYDIRTYGGDLADGDIPEFYPRARGLQDAVAFELGLEETDEGQPLRWGGRLGFDSGAVADQRLSARAPWGRHLTAGGGLQLRLATRWVVQVAYNVAWQLPATVEPGAFDPLDRIECVDAGHDIELPACATVRDGYGAPTNAGDYTRWTHLGRLSVRLEVP